MRPNVLLLQGPVGPFFARFAKDLEHRGFNVFKINFNGGDSFFFRGPNATSYQGRLKHWELYLERYIKNNDIGRIYLFGDCRAYHRVARQVAERLSLRVFVFEEGYIRPDFITLEEGGVNGNSAMTQRKPDFAAIETQSATNQAHPRGAFLRASVYAIIYYLVSAMRKKHYRYYEHHRIFSPVSEGYRWIVSAYRKWRFSKKESNVLEELLPQFENNYFLCPLQVHCDMQVAAHSDFNSIEHFIGDVIGSFVKHAPDNKALVFKHHPLDRGYTDYTLLFRNLERKYGLKGRLFYVHDLCLPTLLKHAQGTVLINSTVGMSSLFHGTPVKTLGKAIYDLPELTFQPSLKRFWKYSGTVDEASYTKFREYLIDRNQLNGSFYKACDGMSDATGLHWSEVLEQEHTFDAKRMDEGSAPRLRLVGGLDVNGPVIGRNDEISPEEIWRDSKSA